MMIINYLLGKEIIDWEKIKEFAKLENAILLFSWNKSKITEKINLKLPYFIIEKKKKKIIEFFQFF